MRMRNPWVLLASARLEGMTAPRRSTIADGSVHTHTHTKARLMFNATDRASGGYNSCTRGLLRRPLLSLWGSWQRGGPISNERLLTPALQA